MNVKQDTVHKFLGFVEKCNTETLNNNDYNIVNTVFNYIGNEHFPFIDELADEAHVSKASITRFIKRHGFSNYQEFKVMMSTQASLLFYNLRVLFYEKHGHISNEQIVDLVYQQAIDNIKETKKNLDISKINQIIDIFEKSKDITFIGDEHDLDEFYMLQLALLTSGKPTYLFKVNETKKIHINYLSDQSTVVFINVADQFFSYYDLLDKMKKIGGKIIYISQDYNEEIIKNCDLSYIYGVPKSINFGYVSLTYLGELLEKLYINR